MSPLFSVIIPTFNRAEYIGEAIESVLGQTDDDFELIVVDDGSTDDTESVLKQYSSRIKVIRQANAGPGAARNRGVTEASGRYVAFLDSDDLWFPYTLAALRQVIVESHFPALITTSPVEFKDVAELETSDHENQTATAERFTDFYASSGQFRFVGSGTMTISREAFLRVGGFETTIRVAEDLDLALRLGTCLGYAFVKSPVLLAYRQHAVSQVASVDALLSGVSYLVNQERAWRYPGAKSRRSERLEILTRFTRSASLAALRQGRVKSGCRLYWRTLTWNLSLGRFRYLSAFLVILAANSVRTASAKLS